MQTFLSDIYKTQKALENILDLLKEVNELIKKNKTPNEQTKLQQAKTH